MKKLILVRHAKTEQLNDFSQSDFDRRLLPRGNKDATLIAEQLKAKDIFPDLFITSKAKRAKQTANIYADILKYKTGDILKEQFIYDGYTTSEMLNFINQLNNKLDSVIIFGHNPDIANFTVNLVNDDIWHFPTSCTTVINFDIKSWKDIKAREGKMELYIYPKMFK